MARVCVVVWDELLKGLPIKSITEDKDHKGILPIKAIRTKMYDFVTKSITGIEFEYCTIANYEEINSKIVASIQWIKSSYRNSQFHSLTPASENQAVTEHYCFSQNKSIGNVTILDHTSADLDKIESGLVPEAFEDCW